MTLYECFAADLLCDRTVLVTGGGSGINLAIAKAFATVGANVGICGRTAERLELAAQELRGLGAEVCATVADVRDPEALENAVSRTVQQLGGLDTVVAGAAGNFLAPVEKISSNGFRTVLAIDLQGAFHTAQASFQQLKDRRGSILFVSAPQAHLPFDSQAHVGAAKAGVESLMRSLAIEWGPYGIRSNSIVPGPIDGTEGLRRVSEQVGLDTWTASTALGRCGTLEEVAAVAVALSCPLGGFITGARIDVDGGLALCGSGLFNRARSGARAPLL